ncbi:histidinol dehydrogenase [Siphonobacter sp. SORGH_AS_1065]|uniref:histidinol dehydrogenase n=1 Tax=Siphonobacter sp. SORGH_AS_1065 TaxID=3041795 RepID=UPI0027837D92|nr:histidinol dehydrogenase [Siphonobacter sp. SORGH_AS_1065]MDQ1089344.1 histidinol dehydrogenase [Siphonobacter sp. SORGH_AS_1065]
MQLIRYPEPETWGSVLARPVQQMAQIEQLVQPILQHVRDHGDAALREYALKFDQVQLDRLDVPLDVIEAAEHLLSAELKEAIQQAASNIVTFHSAQRQLPEKIETMPGVTCWRKSIGIEKVGIYIPGGTAPLFSTVLMLGIPAQLAGCKEIVLCSPSQHPAILYAAKLVGVTKVYNIGGAQAIAAMAYGTESIPQVYKIFGPGNQFVTAAKMLVAKEGIAIDMPAGPSEVAIFADESANPAFVAADLLSQAEHGKDSQVLLVSTSEEVLTRSMEEVTKQVRELPREDFATPALENSKAILVKDEREALDLLNAYAAEHLILSVENAEALSEEITNAGSIFLGHYTPESAGDYASGTNHTLPTNGYARAYSGVSLDSFVKKITVQSISQEGLKNIGSTIMEMAAAESLDAHKKAVEIRLKELGV